MENLISWRYSHAERCFIFKKTDGRKMKIQKVCRILRLNEEILRDVHSQGIPIANLCKESAQLMRALNNRFQPPHVEFEEDPGTTIVWWTFLETGHVKIRWLDGSKRWYPASELLNTADVRVLQQLNTIRPNRLKPSAFLSQFEMDVGLKLEELMALDEDDDDDAPLDEDDDGRLGWYLSDDMTEEDYLG